MMCWLSLAFAQNVMLDIGLQWIPAFAGMTMWNRAWFWYKTHIVCACVVLCCVDFSVIYALFMLFCYYRFLFLGTPVFSFFVTPPFSRHPGFSLPVIPAQAGIHCVHQKFVI